jgi:hypothetical protein
VQGGVSGRQAERDPDAFAHGEPDCDTDCDAFADGHTDRNADAYGHTDADGDTYTDSHAHAFSDRDTQPLAGRQPWPRATAGHAPRQADADSHAEPVLRDNRSLLARFAGPRDCSRGPLFSRARSLGFTPPVR